MFVQTRLERKQRETHLRTVTRTKTVAETRTETKTSSLEAVEGMKGVDGKEKQRERIDQNKKKIKKRELRQRQYKK